MKCFIDVSIHQWKSEKTNGESKSGQSRDNGNNGHRTKAKTIRKNNTPDKRI